MGEKLREVGKVTHYFGRINVAIIEVYDNISVGDKILIKGPNTDIEQTVDSMEIEHSKINEAKSGQNIGMKVIDRVKPKDTIYKTD